MIAPRLLASAPRATMAFRAPALAKRGFATSRVDLANTLLFLEHKKGVINPASLSALTAAKKLGGEIHGLVVAGESEAEEVAKAASK